LTERDEATGLEHTWWRKYDSSSGRWTTPDPYKGSMMIADPQSFNRYAYVGNDPINFVDPSGLCMLVPLDMGEGGIRLVPVLCNDGWFPEPEQPSSLPRGGSRPQQQYEATGG
jgi:RHS repeat-associated protein